MLIANMLQNANERQRLKCNLALKLPAQGATLIANNLQNANERERLKCN